VQGQFHAPQLSPVNKILIAIFVGIFILNTALTQLAQISLMSWLGLSVQGMKSGLFFQLITYPFINQHLMSVIFEGLLLWFIGSELELKWGRRFYLKFLLVTILTSGVFYFLLSFVFVNLSAMPLYGITSFTYGLLMAYAIIYSERQLTFMLIFPMKAKYFCMLLAAIQLYMGLTSAAGASALSHLAAMGGAYLFLNYQSLRSKMANLERQKQKQKMRSHLHIVTEENEAKKPDRDNPRFWQ
jgi:membrane associated rhomboid family serine protease